MQLTASKVEHIVKFAKEMLADGHCVVIGLQSTGATTCEHPALPWHRRICLQASSMQGLVVEESHAFPVGQIYM